MRPKPNQRRFESSRFWTNGTPYLSSFVAEMARWMLDPDTVAEIRCPALVTAAESDPVSADSKVLYNALTCPKRFIQFRSADGAGDHCEFGNRSMANRHILGWLDETLKSRLRNRGSAASASRLDAQPNR